MVNGDNYIMRSITVCIFRVQSNANFDKYLLCNEDSALLSTDYMLGTSCVRISA